MKQTLKLLFFILLVIFQSCDSKNNNGKMLVVVKPKTVLLDRLSIDSAKAKNFEIAYNNNSTAPSYIVFKVKDLNSGLIKEICCEAPFLSGAMHREYHKDYDDKDTRFIDSLILSKRESIFKFKNKAALENIGFKKYPDSLYIEKEKRKYDLDYYKRKYINTDSVATVYFSKCEHFEREVFAHIMFKCGIITSRDCIAGGNLHLGKNKNSKKVLKEQYNK